MWRVTMTKMPIYYAHELGVDLCLEIALFFFEARRNRGLSIAEAAAKSGLSVNDVDELETRGGCYDFAKITNLLELYQLKMPMIPSNFKNMPIEISEKYFAC